MSRRVACCFLAFFVFAVCLQWRDGAFRAEFSGSDEAAHFVTSLMVHDYVAASMPGSPVKFAQDYYARYPKVAFGIWPPLFHLSQAAWMLALSPSRASVLILMAMWAAILAAGCFLAVRSRFGFFAGALLGIVLISLPEIQAAANTVMADLMMSCFIFGAAFYFGRYLDSAKTRDALLFGLLSATAILVKYNALSLALVPPFAMLLARRFDPLRRRSFWLPALVVLLLCGPWYLYNRQLVRYAMDPVPGIADIPRAMQVNLAALIALTGAPLFLLAVLGAFAKLRPASRETARAGVWPAAASLILALWFFHSVLYPSTEGRYLLAAAPALLLFAAAGCQEAARWLAPRLSLRQAPFFAVLVSACMVYGAVTFRIRTKESYGISEVAGKLFRDSGDAQDLFLVSGSPETEGMLISEMALRDRNGRHCVLRASKVLARSTWMGGNYEVLYQTPEQIAQFLRELPLKAIVFDRSRQYNRPHHRLLEQALAAEPALWAPQQMGNLEMVQVYRRTEPVPATAGTAVYLDLSRTLGLSVEVPGVKAAARVQ
ncbi:MAG TPA: glycosyltransferase family 39 protein [Bryobacteraceae bacterium]|nr:glycosyltransferase family 39 protein [Bryobacteraceae bacterium]